MVTNCTSVTQASYNHLDTTKGVRQGKHDYLYPIRFCGLWRL